MSVDLQTRVKALPWFHQIDLGDGLITPGVASIEALRAHADMYFRDGLVSGKSFLDIGCWDGFHSFEAHRRGASRVLATDHFVWQGTDAGWGNRAACELARDLIAPTVEVRDIDIPDLSVETVGTFDVVLFAGVFYHLRHPFQVLEQVAKLADECLIVETHLDALDVDRPAMIFYPGSELNRDGNNWWGPNVACVEAMLRDVGFRRVDFQPALLDPSRGVFHAWR